MNKRIEWQNVKRVLVVRLRSIGDTVLSTPCLIALKRFLPEARIDILLEDWVAPVLENFDAVDNVLTFKKDDLKSRLQTARQIRRNKYDVAFNLHGGTTATFFVRASGAPHRVGFENYRYNFLYNHLLSSSSNFWQKEPTHSAEQQLALLGFVGVPVADKPKSLLVVSGEASKSLTKKLNAEAQRRGEIAENFFDNYALIHPAAAFETKQWATENFARTTEFLSEKGLRTIAVATKNEREVLRSLEKLARVSVITFDDLSLPEITVLAAKAKLFVGNDSGIAHIAAAVGTASVVIFGASNPNHWRPWTSAPNEIVRFEAAACEHELGEIRKGSENPTCIRCVGIEAVGKAIERVLQQRAEISVAEKRGGQLS